MNEEQYEEQLKKIQEAHLESLNRERRATWRPCLHDGCQECHGTGQKVGGTCVHMISCPCQKCSPTMSL